MRDLKILFFSFLMMLGNAPIWAANGKASSVNTVDSILLNDGTIVDGEIVKFGFNSFKVNTNDGVVKISNKDVSIVAVGQDLSYQEKFRLGFLDGKRHAQKKGGNFAIGFLTGLIGTAVVYLTSEQAPSLAAINGSNKAIVNDAAYLDGYAKGARNKVTNNALIGTAVWVGLVVIASVSSVAYVYSYY